MNDSEPTVSEHAELVRVDEIVHGRAVVTFHPTEYGTLSWQQTTVIVFCLCFATSPGSPTLPDGLACLKKLRRCIDGVSDASEGARYGRCGCVGVGLTRGWCRCR